MVQNIFTFQISPLPEAYIPQLAYALETRTELLSREKYPGLWKHTDKLRQIPKVKKSPLRTKLLGIFNLALGIFLFVPGVMKPRELFIPLIVGAIGIGAGIGALLRGKAKRKSRFDKPARQLWEQFKDKPGATVTFTDSEMVITSDDDIEHTPYSDFEYIIETSDLFLVTFVGKVIVLQKDTLSEGTCSDFCQYISEHVPFIDC